MATGGSGDDSTDRVMIAIGKTGTGKSATCNAVLGMPGKFEEGAGGRSVTTKCRKETNTVRGRTLTMIDTPGTMDVADMQKALKELMSAIDQCPYGIDAFLVTFRCDVRATEEEVKAAEQAVDTFGPECYKRAILVFTRGSEFDNDEQAFGEELEKIRKDIPRLDALMSKFDNRWVLIDNGSNMKEKGKNGNEKKEKENKDIRERQVTYLIRLVDQVAAFNPRRYKKEDQQQLVLKRKEELEIVAQALQQNAQAVQGMQSVAQALQQNAQAVQGGMQSVAQALQQNAQAMQGMQIVAQALQQNQNAQAVQGMQMLARGQMEMMLLMMRMQMQAHEMGEQRLERLFERLMDAQQRDRELEQLRERQHMQFGMRLYEDTRTCRSTSSEDSSCSIL